MRIQGSARNQYGLNAPGMRIQHGLVDNRRMSGRCAGWGEVVVNDAVSSAARTVEIADHVQRSCRIRRHSRHELERWHAMCDVRAGFDAIGGTNSGDGTPCATFVPNSTPFAAQTREMARHVRRSWRIWRGQAGPPLTGWASPMCLDFVGVGADLRRIATVRLDSVEVPENETGIATRCLVSLSVDANLWRIETPGTTYRFFSSPSSSRALIRPIPPVALPPERRLDGGGSRGLIERSEMATRPKAELALEAPPSRWQAQPSTGAENSARCLGSIPTSLRQRRVRFRRISANPISKVANFRPRA